MTNEVFPNAKPILLGENTQAPGPLGGSLSVENVQLVLSSPFDSGELSAAQFSTTPTIVSVSLTPVNATNKIKLVGRIDAGSGTASAIIEIREGSNVLADQLIDQGASPVIYTLTAEDENISVSTHTYTMRIRSITAASFQYGNGGTTDTNPDVIAPLLAGGVTDFGDTHVSTITGSDTHTTHEDGVLQ